MEQKRNVSKILLRLGKYLIRNPFLLLFAFALTIASNLLALLGPRLAGYAIDAIEPGKGNVVFEDVFRNIILMIVIYIISSALSYLLSIVMIHLTQRVVRQMRRDVFHKLMDLPVGFFDRIQAGDVISRISYDIDTINTSLSHDTIQIAASLISVVGSFISMLLLSPLLLSVFFITIPISVVFTVLKSKKIRPLTHRRSEALGMLNGYVEEMISGQKTTKAYHREQITVDTFEEKNQVAAGAYYTAEYYMCMVGPAINFINNLSLSLISTLGAILFFFNKISLGNISTFLLYSRKFSGPINEAANIISELQSVISAANRVFNLLDEAEEVADRPDAEILTDVKGDVTFDHVTFGYDPEKPVLKDFTIKVPHGTTVAIVGHTGAGKTTLVNLLMRFYDANEGTILLDSKDITQLTRKSLRSAFTMVLQDTWLFGGTIFENIAYGKDDATEEDVIQAAQAANIHTYIMSLPNGYQTVLTDDGVNLSKGQKQLLTIARAMLSGADLLILDEATSNVDTRTERLIQDAMYRLMEGKTCFVVAHRLSTIQNADMILVMEHGEIVEQGNHDQLMAKQGTYAKLYNAQFE